MAETTPSSPLSGEVDFLGAGDSGPAVVLVHSSVSGARQWRRLIDELKDRFRVRAVNLFGYAKTPPWTEDGTQTLDDQAGLVEAAPHWAHAEVPGAGHMAPLTRPEVINPIVAGFLDAANPR